MLDSLRPVIEQSKDVHTHVDKIVEVAGWMAYEELPMPQMAVPYGLAKDPVVAMDFIMVSTTIDSAFTNFKTHVKFEVEYDGEKRSDSDAMVACLKRAMDSGIPILDGKFLAALTRPQMEKIFAGNFEMPMLDEKLQNFREVGKVLAERYDGYFHNFINSCPPKLYDHGNGLVDRLVKEFPRFNDVSSFNGHEIKFYKLAQLGYWGIYSGLRVDKHFAALRHRQNDRLRRLHCSGWLAADGDHQLFDPPSSTPSTLTNSSRETPPRKSKSARTRCTPLHSSRKKSTKSAPPARKSSFRRLMHASGLTTTPRSGRTI